MAFGIHLITVSRTTGMAIALLPVMVPVAYLLYINHLVSQQTRASIGSRNRAASGSSSSIPSGLRKPVALPPEVEHDDSQWVLSYERVESYPIPLSEVAFPIQTRTDATKTPDLLTVCSRATHTAFSWTPQAFAIRASIKDSAIRRTFESAYIGDLAFEEKDLVNGVYRVAYRGNGGIEGSERVELLIEAPPSYTGPVVTGLIIAAVEKVAHYENDMLDREKEEEQVRLVSETWLWRQQGEKPTLLESKFLGRIHSFMAGWLILKGLEAVKVNKN